jgi:hypothetical protein
VEGERKEGRKEERKKRRGGGGHQKEGRRDSPVLKASTSLNCRVAEQPPKNNMTPSINRIPMCANRPLGISPLTEGLYHVRFSFWKQGNKKKKKRKEKKKKKKEKKRNEIEKSTTRWFAKRIRDVVLLFGFGYLLALKM